MIDIREVDNRFVIVEDNITFIRLRYLWQEIHEILMYGTIVIYNDDYRVDADFIKDELRYLFNTQRVKYFVSRVRIRKSLINDLLVKQTDGEFIKPKRPFKFITTEIVLKINKIYYNRDGDIFLILEIVI